MIDDVELIKDIEYFIYKSDLVRASKLINLYMLKKYVEMINR
ncbi:hypothetical protein HPMBJEAJ_00007 [Aeromonas phage avDM6]|nr:hypothetical protein HPMBJEAJ_00007 [Aeromonas phage avDM6]